MHAWSCSIVYWSFAQQWFIKVITSLECSQRSFYDIRKSLVNINIYSIRAVLTFFTLCIYICICMCMRVGMSLPWCTGGGQRTTCRIQFSSSSLWVLGIELKLLGLTSSTLLASPKQRNRKGLLLSFFVMFTVTVVPEIKQVLQMFPLPAAFPVFRNVFEYWKAFGFMVTNSYFSLENWNLIINKYF